MLLKVLCSTEAVSRSCSCAACKCSVRSATAASSDRLVALVALSEDANSWLARCDSRSSIATSNRIRTRPVRSIASRITPVRPESAVRTASSLCSSASIRSKFALIASIKARPSPLALSASNPAVSSACVKPDRCHIHGKPAGNLRFGVLQQLRLAWIVPGCLRQLREGRRDPVRSFTVFPEKVRVADEPETARRALRAADQKLEVGKLRQHLQRVIDPGRVGSRLDVEAYRGRAHDQENRKADTQNNPLRCHQGRPFMVNAERSGPPW